MTSMCVNIALARQRNVLPSSRAVRIEHFASRVVCSANYRVLSTTTA